MGMAAPPKGAAVVEDNSTTTDVARATDEIIGDTAGAAVTASIRHRHSTTGLRFQSLPTEKPAAGSTRPVTADTYGALSTVTWPIPATPTCPHTSFVSSGSGAVMPCWLPSDATSEGESL
jgi:hypothetical protein